VLAHASNPTSQGSFIRKSQATHNLGLSIDTVSPPCIAYSATVACDAKIRAVCEIAIVRPGTYGQVTAIGNGLPQAMQPNMVEEGLRYRTALLWFPQSLGLTPQVRTVFSLPQL
jgi:hypothetical protein